MTTSDNTAPYRHAVSPSRFEVFADLSEAERHALRDLAGDTATFARDQVIRHEGDRPDIFVLHEGWVASSASFDDGSRQVVKVHLPGDFLGAPSLPYAAAADTLTALTSVRISKLSPEAIGRLFQDTPRLGMLCFLVAQEERIILMERLMSIGRRRGPQRLAAFLLHIYDRLRVIEADYPLAIELPLTLEQIGDVVGLHAVHVSRTFSRLERHGLIRRDNRRIHLLDLDELRCQAGFPERTIVRNAPWLPASTAV